MIYDLIEYVLENGSKSEVNMAKSAGEALDKLEADYTNAIKANAEVAHLNANLQSELAAMREAVTKLREFAERYGQHLPNCPNRFSRSCDCGYYDDLKAIQKLGD
jgi:hypothetical protein